MAALLALVLPLGDIAEEGKHIIIAMLLTGLLFCSVIAVGELSRWRRHRKRGY